MRNDRGSRPSCGPPPASGVSTPSSTAAAYSQDRGHVEGEGWSAGAEEERTITGFSPQTAPTGGLVTVTGTNFTDQTYVLFNGVSAARAI
ncbi:MAG TPA: IPT/TIG domain-containing protein [Archangium sp.]|nr:IPT/TIG domain-containing protein [Archangium sp.]